MKQRQPAQEQRGIRVEHVVGHTGQRDAERIGDEVDDPIDLRQQDADRAHRDEQRALDPDREKRDDQRDIAEIKEVRRPVEVPVDRDQHRHEGRVGELERQRQAVRGLHDGSSR